MACADDDERLCTFSNNLAADLCRESPCADARCDAGAEFDLSGQEACVSGELPCALPSSVYRPVQQTHAMSGWLDVDYLMWWTRGASLPPLVSSSSIWVPRQQAGVLGESTTDVVFGDERVNGDLHSGVRLNAGVWLDDCCT